MEMSPWWIRDDWIVSNGWEMELFELSEDILKSLIDAKKGIVKV